MYNDPIIRRLMENRQEVLDNEELLSVENDNEDIIEDEESVEIENVNQESTEELEEAFNPLLDEDLKKYKGKPMKELLKALHHSVRFSIDTKRPTHYGSSGFSGRANQITWEYADLIIKDISAADGKYNDVKVVL